jgi:hypothetical protein
MNTIGEVLNRLRNQVKSTAQDAFLTDRFLYSMVMKHAKWLLRREDAANKILRLHSAFQALDVVDLIDVSAVEAQCRCITSDCTFKRTAEKLPRLIDGYYGPLIRTITSLDNSQEVLSTTARSWEQIARNKNFKYNKHKYFWYLDGHLYFPNVEWDAVRVEALFEDDISKYNCDKTDDCGYRQDDSMMVVDYLYAEIESNVMKELGVTLGIPSDPQEDKKHIMRN